MKTKKGRTVCLLLVVESKRAYISKKIKKEIARWIDAINVQILGEDLPRDGKKRILFGVNNGIVFCR